MKIRTQSLLAALSAVALAINAHAATWWWDGGTSLANGASDNATTTNQNWFSDGNWDNGATSASLPSWTAGDSAVFGGSAASQTVTAGTLTIGDLTFGAGGDGSGTSGTAYTLSGGTLTLSSPTQATNNTPTTIGSSLAGTGGLTLYGAATLSLTAAAGNNSYTGGTIVNGGTLSLNTGGASGCIRGSLTINANGTVTSSSSPGHPFGYNGGSTGVTNMNINGGTLNCGSASANGNAFHGVVNMTGGTINGIIFEPYSSSGSGPNPAFNTFASSSTAVISVGTLNLRSGAASVPFTVAAGTTPSGVDLLLASAVTRSQGSTSLQKLGPGTMLFSGTNNAVSTTVSAGTLLVNGLIGGGTVTVQSGGTLGGVGRITVATTVGAGGTLAAGTNSTVGTLTFGNTLTLNATGTNFMRLTKDGGVATNDVVKGWTGTLAYTGALVVANVTANPGANPLANGDTFTLFVGTGSGGFSSMTLPALPGGLVWDTSALVSSGQIKVAQANQLAQPTFTPSAGGYLGAISVAISNSTPGVTIYYTTNGSTPTNTSAVYSSPIPVPVNSSLTLKAYASKSGMVDSLVATGSFVTMASATWTNLALTGSWPAAANWSNGIVANGVGATADFSTLTLAGNTVLTLDSTPVVGSLLFGDQGNAFGWTLNAGSGGPLTVAGTNCTINVSNQTTTIAVALAGTNILTKTGNGTLTLTGRSTLSGPVTVNGGNLRCEAAVDGSGNGTLYNVASVTVNTNATLVSGANGLFGWGTHYIPLFINNGGTLTEDGGTGGGPNIYGDLTLAGGTVEGTLANLHTTYGSYNFGGKITATGGTISTISALDFQFRNPITVQVDAGSVLDVTGYFTPLAHGGSDTLTKTGAGTLILAGANTYGATVVSNGVLQVDGTGSLPSASLTVVSNATLQGTGTINGPTTVQAGGTLTLGTTNTGILTISSTLTLAGNTVLKVNKTGGAPASDNIYGLSGVTYGGKLTVTNITSDGNSLTNGDTFTLFTKTGGGSYNGAFTSFILPPLPAGLSWDKSGLATGGYIQVVNSTPTPTFAPPGGGYAGAVSVTISSSAGSTIHYTTDGIDPRISATTVSAPSPATVLIPVNTASLTLSAYATSAGAADSGLQTATYSTVATPTWTGLYGGSWAAAYNWSNSVVADAAGVTADFSQLTLVQDEYLTLDGARTVGHMVFGDLGGAFNWDLQTGSGGPLIILDAGTNVPSIVVLTNAVNLGVVLDGSTGLTKTGNGTLKLSTNELYTGDTVVNGGTLAVAAGGAAYNDSTLLGKLTVNSGAACQLDSTDAFGWGGGGLTDIYLNGGTLNGSNSCSAFGISYHLSGGTITNAGNIRLGIETGSSEVSINSTSNGVTSVIAPTGGLYFENRFGQSTFVISTERGSAPGGVDLRFDTAISQNGVYGAHGLVKAGLGTLLLNAANTYTGPTTISNGTLLVNGSLSASSAVTITPGGTLGGTGTVAGSVAVRGTVSPGASVGHLTTGAQTWYDGSTLVYQVASADTNNTAGRDLLTINGTLDLERTNSGVFTLKLVSMVNSNTQGNVPDFDASSPYTWTVGTATGLTNAGNLAYIVVDATAFSNAHGGTFTPAFDLGSQAILIHYSPATVNTTPTALVSSVSGSSLTLSWPQDHTGWTLQTQTNSRSLGLTGTWFDVSGSAATNQMTFPVDRTQPTVFYRLKY
jgi:autotransporter-associated beta strand protein